MNDEQTQTQEQQQKLLSNEMMEIYEKYVTLIQEISNYYPEAPH